MDLVFCFKMFRHSHPWPYSLLLHTCTLILFALLFSSMANVLATSSTTAVTSSKPKNSDLLAFKMYPEFEDFAEEEPIELARTLSRFQRHARRRDRNRKNRNRRRQSTPTTTTTMSPASLAALQRAAFFSLKSSDVGQIGPAPSVLTKRKNGFCKTIPYKQKISENGCESKTIINSYCFGACNSFYIPSDGNKSLPFTSCSFCLPRRYRWTTVRLRCPLYQDSDTGDDSSQQEENKINNEYLDQDPADNRRTVFAYKHKKIQIVTKCRCQAEMT